MKAMHAGPRETFGPATNRQSVLLRALLYCGILASLLYAAMNIFVPMLYPGYDMASQTVSEISAIGAPSRPLWVALGLLYTLLIVLFGLGVLFAAGASRALKVAGTAIVINSLAGLFWAPMHQRGTEISTTDTLHIISTMLWLVLTLVTMGFGAAAFGRAFRWYSVATVIVFVVFGFLTGLDAPRIQANQPTPLVGVWERVNIAAFLLWLVLFTVALLRRQEETRAGEPVG